MKSNRLGKIIALILISSFVLCGCGKESKAEIELSKAQRIAELATLKAYYHDVIKVEKDKSGAIFGLGDIGYKKMWVEYTGIVSMAVDVSKIIISQPDENGVVTVKMPKEVIVGEADIDEESISEPLIDKGWFTKITTEERKAALIDSQSKMLEKAKADKSMQNQARERAKLLLEEYIKNVGTALGKEYTVKWEDA